MIPYRKMHVRAAEWISASTSTAAQRISASRHAAIPTIRYYSVHASNQQPTSISATAQPNVPRVDQPPHREPQLSVHDGETIILSFQFTLYGPLPRLSDMSPTGLSALCRAWVPRVGASYSDGQDCANQASISHPQVPLQFGCRPPGFPPLTTGDLRLVHTGPAWI